MEPYTIQETNTHMNRALHSLFKMSILINFAVVSIVVLLNQQVIAADECENIPEIVTESDSSFYVQRYSESLSRYFNNDETKAPRGNGSSLNDAFVVDKQDANVVTTCYNVIGKMPDIVKVIKNNNKIYYICFFSIQEGGETIRFQVFFHMRRLKKITPPLS